MKSIKSGIELIAGFWAAFGKFACDAAGLMTGFEMTIPAFLVRIRQPRRVGVAELDYADGRAGGGGIGPHRWGGGRALGVFEPFFFPVGRVGGWRGGWGCRAAEGHSISMRSRCQE